MFFDFEVLAQFVVNFKEFVEGVNKLFNVAGNEVALVGLQHEVLVDALTLDVEEAPELLDASVLPENILILILRAVGRVVPHQVLGQVNAGIESLSNAFVNRVDCEKVNF